MSRDRYDDMIAPFKTLNNLPCSPYAVMLVLVCDIRHWRARAEYLEEHCQEEAPVDTHSPEYLIDLADRLRAIADECDAQHFIQSAPRTMAGTADKLASEKLLARARKQPKEAQ